MKRFSEQLHKKSLAVKLSASEKRELRERVVSYMEYHPLPNKATQTAPKASPYFTEAFTTLPFSYLFKAGAAVAVLLVVIIPALAEQAVPGDGLYAIKVRFNEEVRSTLALTSYEKIEWETERLNRRIAEARLLASEGRLTDEVEAEVAAAVKTHTDNAKREIEVLRTEDEEEANLASITLSTTLEVQAASLKDKNNANDVDEGDNSSTDMLAAAVEEVVSSSGVTAGVPGYERLIARVESNTTRIHELLKTLNLEESSEDYQDVNRRLQDINRTVEDAIIQKGIDEDGARLILVDALQRTQKLIVFLTEIQTSQEFEVEDFVPVVLTPEEERIQLAEFEKSSRVFLSDIEDKRASSSDANAIDKATVALDELVQLQGKLASTTSVEEARGLFSIFEQLARDTLGLFGQEEIVSQDETPIEDTGRSTTSEDIQTETAE